MPDLSSLETVLLASAGLLVVLVVVFWVLWRRVSVSARSLMKRIGRLPFRANSRRPRELPRDGRAPRALHFIPPALVLYLAMPIDIIPDFVPVLGQLDDLIVLVAGIGLLLRFVPRQVLEEHVAALE